MLFPKAMHARFLILGFDVEVFVVCPNLHADTAEKALAMVLRRIERIRWMEFTAITCVGLYGSVRTHGSGRDGVDHGFHVHHFHLRKGRQKVDFSLLLIGQQFAC